MSEELLPCKDCGQKPKILLNSHRCHCYQALVLSNILFMQALYPDLVFINDEFKRLWNARNEKNNPFIKECPNE